MTTPFWIAYEHQTTEKVTKDGKKPVRSTHLAVTIGAAAERPALPDVAGPFETCAAAEATAKQAIAERMAATSAPETAQLTVHKA